MGGLGSQSCDSVRGNKNAGTTCAPDAAMDQVVRAAAHEAKAVAVGAGEQAVRVGLAVRGGLMNTFLPAGYPASVRPEYVRYRCWDIVQVSSNFHKHD